MENFLDYFLHHILPHLGVLVVTGWFCFGVCVWASVEKGEEGEGWKP